MTAPRTAVERALDQRRLDLKLTWRDIHVRARISPETLRKIRLHGTTGVDPVNVAAVEDALRLERGSIGQAQAGRGVVPLPVPDPDDDGMVLVDAPGGGRMWQLRRLVRGEEVFVSISARGVSRDWAREELGRIADRLEWERMRS